MVRFAGSLVFGVLAVFVAMKFVSRVSLPEHLLHHSLHEDPELLSFDASRQLIDLVQEMKDFPSNAADTSFYKTTHEHIGEAIAIGDDGKCAHEFLVPNSNRSICVLPGRIDIGRHYILSGGVDGLKESFDGLLNRIQSFGRYMFNPAEYPVVMDLFKSDKFQSFAKKVCPLQKQFLDPFQFNFIVQVPGQTVAAHIDAPYFWGASRFQFPQWLLAVMVYSGLFQHEFIDQVQVVAYVHQWEDKNRSRGGDFVFWTSNDPVPMVVHPDPRSGSVVDGSKTVHAAVVYQGDVKPPRIDKSAKNVLRFVGGDDWNLLSNDEVIESYKTDDLRISIVYRARCFADEAESIKYHSMQEGDMMKLEDILETLRSDLVKRGRLSMGQVMPALDFALLLMDEYIQYPLSHKAFIPFNYCAVSKKLPQLQPILNLICS